MVFLLQPDIWNLACSSAIGVGLEKFRYFFCLFIFPRISTLLNKSRAREPRARMFVTTTPALYSGLINELADRSSSESPLAFEHIFD
jgi:hypothetical protein